jgi:hypothetical protein
MATVNTPIGPTPIVLKVTRKVFNLATMAKETRTGEVTFTPASTLPEILERENGKVENVVSTWNVSAQRKAKIEGRKSIDLGNDANIVANPKVLMDFLRPVRSLPPFNTMDKAQQNAALFAWLMIPENKLILDGIKSAAVASAESDEDEDETEE